MNQNRFAEYRLDIRGPSVIDLANFLATEHGWVFSSIAQTSFFAGYAIGYIPWTDAREFEGFAISTDQTRVASIEPILE